MKKLFMLLLSGFLSAASVNAQTSDYSMARTGKVGNKIVFYDSEPVADYKVVFTFQNDIGKENDLLTTEIMEKSVLNANREAANQGKHFDAVIVQHGTTRDIAIQFKNESQYNSTAQVKRIDGIYVFINAEPIGKYEVVKKYKSSKQLDYAHIRRLIKRGLKDDVVFNGIIYGTSGSELLVHMQFPLE